MKPLENITIDMAFKRSVEKFPDNEAIVYCDTRLTYRELDKLIDDFALKFINLGIKHGSHVGIWCESEPNLVISMMAVERIGAVAVLINTSLKTKEVYSILDDTRVDYPVMQTVSDEEFYNRNEQLNEEIKKYIDNLTKTYVYE